MVLGYTLQIPVTVMAIVYILDLAHKYGYFLPISWVLIVTFAAITVHAGYQIWRVLFFNEKFSRTPFDSKKKGENFTSD